MNNNDFSKRHTNKITKIARDLRNNTTKAEKILWEKIRNRQILGYKFRRQYPFYQFVLDFYCNQLKLAIEVEGEIHSLQEVKEYDDERRKLIVVAGITVLRFSNNEVEHHLEDVIEQIKNKIKRLEV